MPQLLAKGEPPAGSGARTGERRVRERDVTRKAWQAFRDCADCPEMVVAPDRSYAVGVSEVTRGEWAAFVRATGYVAGHSCWTYEHGTFQERRGRSWRNPGFSQTARHPVVCVNWHDAQEYVRWLRAKTGQAYRLSPNEAEWVDVARWMNLDRTPAVLCDDGPVGPAPVDVPNGQGMYDMLGHVWEWVEDCCKGDCRRRVVSGGNWDFDPRHVRSAYHVRDDAGGRSINGIFRVARTLTP